MPRRRSPAGARRRVSRGNRRYWDSTARSYEARHGRSVARVGGLAWGFWRIPESRLRLLGPVRGRRVLELGCGAARWSIGLRRQGAQVVGIDFSAVRLRQAALLARAAHVRLPLVQGTAESLPFPSSTFDTVFCDWGAMTFADPYATVPEVARVLRPGGVFAFSTSSPIRFVALDRRTDRMQRRLLGPYFGQHRIRFEGSSDYSLPYGEWIRLFSENGLLVERLLEPIGGLSRRSTYLPRDHRVWSGSYPLEIIWALRRGSGTGRGREQPSSRARSRSRR